MTIAVDWAVKLNTKFIFLQDNTYADGKWDFAIITIMVNIYLSVYCTERNIYRLFMIRKKKSSKFPNNQINTYVAENIP